jgi:tetratricopeptide (TPR) repeat protein
MKEKIGENSMTYHKHASLLTLLLLITSSFAQSVRWSAPLETDVNEPFTVSLVFEDCQPEGNIILPRVDGLTFTFSGQNRQINMIQGRVTSQNAFIYTVRANRADRFELPSFSIKTTAGTLTVAELVLAVRQSSQAGSSNSLDAILAGTAVAQLTTNITEAWTGQIIPLEYRLLVNPRRSVQLAGPMVWPGTGWLAETWSEPERGEAFHSGAHWISLTQKTQIMTDVPGERVLEPATQKLIITTGRRNTWPFPQPINEQATVTTPDRVITIKPLPPPPDETFTGAVGQFDMISTVTPQSVTADEPLTWTLIISGTGNWPSNFRTPQREIPQGWRVITPEVIRENPPGKIFQASIKEEAVLIPDLPGNFTLPSVVFTYFDPTSGQYKTITTEEISISVTPSPMSSSQATSRQQTPHSDLVPTPPELPPQALATVMPVEKPDPAVPRDPLAGASRAAAPLAHSVLLGLTLTPWLLIPVCLALLGIANASATDPARIRLAARQHMLLAISKAKTLDSSAEQASCLHHWLQGAKKYWGITKAVPAASDIQNSPLLSKENTVVRNTWCELFAQADAFLYGAQPSLPPTWLATAEEAAKKLRPQKRHPLSGLHPTHLFPKPAVVIIAAASAAALACASQLSKAFAQDTQNFSSEATLNPSAQQQTDPEAAYRSGDWQTAEKIWRQKTEIDPRDWHAHNNLALALLQQKLPREASAHLLAARLLAPHSQDVAWNGRLATKQLTALTPELSLWLGQRHKPQPAAFFNAAAWQWIGIFSSWMAALATLSLICWPHFPSQKRRLNTLAVILFIITLPTGSASVLALTQWGAFQDPHLVILRQEATLRSLPSEADDQISREARPGETAIATSRFLTWVKLKFPSGEHAWTQKKSLIPVYQPIPEN